MTSTTTITFDGSSSSAAPIGFALPPAPEAVDWAIGPRRWSLYFPTVPVIDTFFDIATVALILCFLFLSLLSLSLILHLRLKSRRTTKLRSFTAHWTARFLMIILISLWSINEFLRLPIFRKRYIFPFLPLLSLPRQTQFCKFHLILSFGLYEPGFLVCLLFLVNISIKKRSPNNLWAIGFVAITSLPLVVALYFAVHVLPGRLLYLPPIFYRSSAVLEDEKSGSQVVYCTYPLVANVIFAAFGVCYALVFLLSCCKVMSLAINKRLRARVNTLAYTILICLSIQMVMLTVSVFWDPENVWYYLIVLVHFVCVLVCGAVCEGVLVIKPIADALSVGNGGESV